MIRKTKDWSGEQLGASRAANRIAKIKSKEREWYVSLFLCGNAMTGNLPTEISLLPNLETLWVTGNMLTGLTDELTRLYKLDNLRLDRNELTFLPSYIGEMTSLTHLGLNDNKITKLPPEMANLTKLESLYLAGNPLPEHLAIDAGTKEQTQALLKAIAEHFAPKKKAVEPEGPQPEKITADGNNNNNNDNAKKDVDDEQPVIEEVPEK